MTDQESALTGKWLIAASVVMGVIFFLSCSAAVTSLIAMGASTLLVIICLISAVAALSRRDLALLRSRAIAITILILPPIAFIADGNLHLTDRIRLLFLKDCAFGGVPIDFGHSVSVCLKRDREGWGEIEAIVYDSSDQVARQQGDQSRAWSAAAAQLHLPFNVLPFRAISFGNHYYLVQFNEN
jgi:hypothetical protein